MGQSEIMKVLEKHKGPLSVSEIAELANDSQAEVNRDLNRLLKYSEIFCIELDRLLAKKFYNCTHKMRLYYV